MTDFVPENDLERALVAASTDRAREHDFYRCLLDSQVFVIEGGGEERPTGTHTLQEGATLQIPDIEIDGRRHVTAFTSVTRLQRFLTQPTRYVSMRATDFLGLIGGTPVCLNPGAEYGKLLLPGEIAALLDGSIFSSGPRRVVMRKATEYLIGSPKDPPVHVTRALVALFKTRRDVRVAHLAWWVDPKSGVPPHAVVGLDVDGRWDDVMAASGRALQGVTGPDEIVDFFRLDDSDESGMASAIRRQAPPFFQRRRLWPFG